MTPAAARRERLRPLLQGQHAQAVSDIHRLEAALEACKSGRDPRYSPRLAPTYRKSIEEKLAACRDIEERLADFARLDEFNWLDE